MLRRFATPGLLLGLAVGLWWAGNLYRGFEHDAVFYGAEALNMAGTVDLRADPFFKFGAQGRFSLFITPYSWLIGWLGLPMAAWWVTVLGKCAWVLAAWSLARSLSTRTAPALVGLAALLLIPRPYEPWNVFTVAESFATPRLLAETLTMAGLAAAVRGSVGRSLASSLLALTLHPLMGLAGMAVTVWASLARPDRPFPYGRQAAVSAAGLASILALAVMAIGPFGDLLRVYDPAWWPIVEERCIGALAQKWDPEQLANCLGLWLLLATNAYVQPARTRQRALAVGLAAVSALCLAAWILGSLSHNVLLIQLQLWRVMWLVRCLLPLLWAGWLSQQGLSRELSSRNLTLVLLLAAATMASLFSTLAVAVAVALVCIRSQDLDRHLTPARQRAVAGAMFACLAGFHLAGLVAFHATAQHLTTAPYPWLQAIAWDPVIVVLICAAVVIADQLRPRARPDLTGWANGLASVLAVTGVAFWMYASQRYLATGPDFTALQWVIPRTATVYWRFTPERTWLELGRAHYANGWQGASVLFSRPQALELQARLQRLHKLGLTQGPEVWPEDIGAAQLTDSAIQTLCRDMALDFVIDDLKGVFTLPHRTVAIQTTTYQVFDCSALRARTGS